MINEFDIHNVVCIVPPLLHHSIVDTFTVLYGGATIDYFVLHANGKSDIGNACIKLKIIAYIISSYYSFITLL